MMWFPPLVVEGTTPSRATLIHDSSSHFGTVNLLAARVAFLWECCVHVFCSCSVFVLIPVQRLLRGFVQNRRATRYSNLSAGAGSVTCLHARMLSRPVKLNMRSEVLVQTWVIANASGKAESLADICTEILQWPPGLHAVQ